MLFYNITSTMLRVHTDVFMKVYCYSINSVTTMVVTHGYKLLSTHMVVQLHINFNVLNIEVRLTFYSLTTAIMKSHSFSPKMS